MTGQTQRQAEVIRETYEVCVVGGGMAGLCAAVGLRNNDFTVWIHRDIPVRY